MGDKKHVCIIGAGPCGMSALYQFDQLVDPSVEMVCYEKVDNWAGFWNYIWLTGTIRKVILPMHHVQFFVQTGLLGYFCSYVHTILVISSSLLCVSIFLVYLLFLDYVLLVTVRIPVPIVFLSA